MQKGGVGKFSGRWGWGGEERVIVRVDLVGVNLGWWLSVVCSPFCKGRVACVEGLIKGLATGANVW